MEKLKSGPLEGITVLDFTWVRQVHLQRERLQTWEPTSLKWNAIVTEQMKGTFLLSWKQKKV